MFLLSTYREVYENYVNQLQELAKKLNYSTENIRLFEIVEKMKKLGLIKGYELLYNGPSINHSLHIIKYPDEYYNNIFEES